MKNATSGFHFPEPAHARRAESYVRAISGTLILLSVALAVSLNEWWLVLTLLVGLNLIQSMLTGWCPLAEFVERLFPALRRE